MGIPDIGSLSLFSFFPASGGQALSFTAYFLLLATLGATFITFIAGIRSAMSVKPMLVKFSQQACHASVVCFGLFIIVFEILLAVLALDETQKSLVNTSGEMGFAELCQLAWHNHSAYFFQEIPLPLCIFIILLATYLLKKHSPCNILGHVFSFFSVASLLLLYFWWAGTTQQGYAPLTVLPEWSMVFVRLFTSIVGPESFSTSVKLLWKLCLGIAAGGLVLMPWLIIRRNKDDFGRDYYFFAMRTSALTVIVGNVLSLIPALVYFGVQYNYIFTTNLNNQAIFAALACGFLIVICILLFRILFCQTPMRHKVSIFLSLVMFFLALVWQSWLSSVILPIL